MANKHKLVNCIQTCSALRIDRFQRGFQALYASVTNQYSETYTGAIDDSVFCNISNSDSSIEHMLVGVGIASIVMTSVLRLTGKHPATLKPVWIFATQLPHIVSLILLKTLQCAAAIVALILSVYFARKLFQIPFESATSLQGATLSWIASNICYIFQHTRAVYSVAWCL